jgi:Ca2+-binding EF-hand superfamily protein
MLPRLYRWLIRLHPSCFRQRFAEEMLGIFEEVSGGRAVASLFADALVSLFRQWVLRSEFRQPMMAAAISNGSPDIPVFRSLDTYQPRPAALLNGGILAVAVLYAVFLAIGHGGSGRQAFLIGAHRPGLPLFPLERASFTPENELNTVVKFGPAPEDPWHAIASLYFKLSPVLRALDADGDLILSPWEIVTAPAALRRLDRDHDGKLSAEECGFFLGADSKMVLDPQFVKRARLDFMGFNPVLAALDADHDGEISETEILNSAAALRKLDKNGDGSLTPDELIPDQAANQAALILSRLDTNRDGRISAAEWARDEAEPLRDLLKSADRNHDGVTTAEELTRELRLQEEQRRQFENAVRAAGLGRSGSGAPASRQGGLRQGAAR